MKNTSSVAGNKQHLSRNGCQHNLSNLFRPALAVLMRVCSDGSFDFTLQFWIMTDRNHLPYGKNLPCILIVWRSREIGYMYYIDIMYVKRRFWMCSYVYCCTEITSTRHGMKYFTPDSFSTGNTDRPGSSAGGADLLDPLRGTVPETCWGLFPGFFSFSAAVATLTRTHDSCDHEERVYVKKTKSGVCCHKRISSNRSDPRSKGVTFRRRTYMYIYIGYKR